MKRTLMGAAAMVLLLVAVGVGANSACWQPVESPAFDAMRYDAHRGVLALRFDNGTTYEYFGVSREIARHFGESPDKESFFARFIRKAYDYRRLPTVEEHLLVAAE